MKKFLKIVIAFSLFGNSELFAVSPLFRWVQYKYDGDVSTYDSVKKVLWELTRITSVEVVAEPYYGDLNDENLFMSPFIYITGKNVSPAFGVEEKRKILLHISAGGLWLVDSSSEDKNSLFLTEIKKEFEDIFGTGSIKPVLPSSVIFRTFFLFQKEMAESFELEGIDVDGRTAVIFSKNLLQNAPEKKYYMRLLINIIMYSLTTDYKLDQVHQPFIKRRLR